MVVVYVTSYRPAHIIDKHQEKIIKTQKKKQKESYGPISERYERFITTRLPQPRSCKFVAYDFVYSATFCKSLWNDIGMQLDFI